MTTAININKFVRIFVQSDPELLAICPLNNIKPLVLPPNKFPFISFMHGDITPNYTKDGLAYDEVDLLFACVSNDYEQTIALVERLRELLEQKKYEDDEVLIPIINVKSISEDFIDNAFLQIIIFSLQIVPKQ